MLLNTVRACPLPPHSALGTRISKGDLVDCYAASGTLAPRQAAEIIVQFPGWANALVALRRIVTMPFGLCQDGPETSDKIGPFPVELETENELIAGFDDKHLDFRISVIRDKDQIMLATWAHPHNIGGRIYLGLILPFHILIARDAVARAARSI